ncbi:hypothetical protein IT570_07285 [Candidatus Sumerlaeota bacterium]|nr:hypothetical protein [Candidatus Sumerlaeota bacterium]
MRKDPCGACGNVQANEWKQRGQAEAASQIRIAQPGGVCVDARMSTQGPNRRYGRFPASQVYLIYGNNEAEVGNLRFELVSSILTPEERDAGLTELRSPGNAPLTLRGSLSEIIGELGTSSFIAGSRRVLVVHDLKDFYEARAGRGRKTAAKGAAARQESGSAFESFESWMKNILPTTENIVVFVCQENDEKQRVVAEQSELYQLCQQIGHVLVKRDKALNFEFEDLIFSRNVNGAVKLLRTWIRRGGGDSLTRGRIYGTVASIIELVFEAKCVAEARAENVPVTQVAVQGFPSLGRLPEWKAKKVSTFAGAFKMSQVLALLEQSNRLQAIMYPTGDEDYVPNWEDFLESLTVQLAAPPAR